MGAPDSAIRAVVATTEQWSAWRSASIEPETWRHPHRDAEDAMSKVIFDISMSLDGFITAANRRPEEPMGDGGENDCTSGRRRRRA